MEKSVDPAAFDTLADTADYARPIEDFGATEVSQDHLQNLLDLEKMLITKRRYMAQDVQAYPVVFQTRMIDIANLQSHLRLLREAIAEERQHRIDSI